MNYIYADFNGWLGALDDDDFDFIDLTGYGTIHSLNSLGIRLKEGMKFIFYETNDIEVLAEVVFDRTTPSLISKEGRWLAKYKAGTVKDCSFSESANFNIHPCFNCRADFKPLWNKIGQNYNERCTNCGTPIGYPLLAPEKE